MVAHMKLVLAILAMGLCLPVMGADKKPKIVPNGPKAKAAIEKEIRFRLDKPTGTRTSIIFDLKSLPEKNASPQK